MVLQLGRKRSSSHQPSPAHGLWSISHRIAPDQLCQLCPHRITYTVSPQQHSQRNKILPYVSRIAHRIRDMQRLPYVVTTNKHIKEVYDLYYHAFDTFRKIKEVKTLEDNDKLCELISHNLKGHLTVIPQLAMGILECGGLMSPSDLDKFMNTILRSVSCPFLMPLKLC